MQALGMCSRIAAGSRRVPIVRALKGYYNTISAGCAEPPTLTTNAQPANPKPPEHGWHSFKGCPKGNSGWILANGALGAGWNGCGTGCPEPHVVNRSVQHLTLDPYTVSTMTTGGAVASMLFTFTADESAPVDASFSALNLRTVAVEAMHWLAAEVLPNGTIPLVSKNQTRSATVNPTALLTYAAEAVIAAHMALPELRPFLSSSFERSVHFLVSSQLPNGSWPYSSKDERIRAARAVTLLSWYNATTKGYIAKNAAAAVGRFAAMLRNRADAYGVKQDVMLAGFVGLAVCDIVQFGSTFA